MEFTNGNLFPSVQLFHGDVCCGGTVFAGLEDSQQDACLKFSMLKSNL